MPAPVENILVIRFSSIGDILLASPLLRILKKHYPHATLTFATKKQFVDLVRTNPHVDSILAFDPAEGLRGLRRLRAELKRRSFDVIIDIHNNFRSQILRSFQPGARVFVYKKYRWQRFLLIRFGWNLYSEIIPVYRRYLDCVSSLGIADDGLGLEFFPEAEVKRQVQARLREAGVEEGAPVIAMAPGASFATKRWPVEYFADVAKRWLEVQKSMILLLGGENDREITSQIAKMAERRIVDLAGELNLMETACALSECRLLITNDTGLMHLANALKIKTLAIFGPTTRELGFYPDERISRVVENEQLKCRPCTHVGRQRCPKKHFKCMVDIEPDHVYEVARRLWENLW